MKVDWVVILASYIHIEKANKLKWHFFKKKLFP